MSYAKLWEGRIDSRPEVLAGKPCIRGTRVSVEVILDTLSATGTIADTVAAFPRITEEDVRAAILYAADVLNNDDLDALPDPQ
jgi:uncharacterized protein (DUF433 family)